MIDSGEDAYSALAVICSIAGIRMARVAFTNILMSNVMWETTEDVRPLPGKQELAFKTKADFMIYGGARGSGKSVALYLRPLEFVNDPKFRAIFFRRKFAEIMGAGGLWQGAGGVYPLFGGDPVGSKYKFPAKSEVSFGHMYLETDKESHRGLQYSFIGFDEIDQFSKEQVMFLLTCLRSEAKMESFCIGTCNPNPDSWVYGLIKWYLDEEGYPDESKCGIIRHYIVKDGDFIFADSEEYFQRNYPSAVYVKNPKTGKEIYIRPKTFTFINSTIFDNQPLIESNPGYLSELQNLPEHEKSRQLWGNWHARPTGANYFERSWLKSAEIVPRGSRGCRAWDKAHTEVSEANRYPDYTACSPKIFISPNGDFFLVGDYIKECADKDKDGKFLEEKGRFRKRPGERDRIMILQAKADGSDLPVIIPEETAGKDSYEATKKKFLEEGFIVRRDVMPKTHSKLVKFEPFSAACQDGFVYILRHTFSDETYTSLMKSLEAFTGRKSGGIYKDDEADAIASAFNYISRQKKEHKSVPRNQGHFPTFAKSVLDNFKGKF